MIKLSESDAGDIPRLDAWIKADAWHHDQGQPEWWLTGGGMLSFRLDDSHGPIAYIRLDREDHRVRLSTQFAPSEEVSKIRMAKGMIQAIPIVVKVSKATTGVTELYFNSENPPLIHFMSKFGFSVTDDEHVLIFEE